MILVMLFFFFPSPCPCVNSALILFSVLGTDNRENREEQRYSTFMLFEPVIAQMLSNLLLKSVANDINLDLTKNLPNDYGAFRNGK